MRYRITIPSYEYWYIPGATPPADVLTEVRNNVVSIAASRAPGREVASWIGSISTVELGRMLFQSHNDEHKTDAPPPPTEREVFDWMISVGYITEVD